MGWTEERVELLKKLWMEGFSASQIANELGDGVTRNAVIGKVHRLKLSGRAKPVSAAPRVRTAPRSNGQRRIAAPAGGGARASLSGMMKERRVVSAPLIGAPAQKISEVVEHEVYVAPQTTDLFIPEENRLTLLQLSDHTCKWPIGDPLTPDFYFCGQHSDDGHPYCEFHSRRAYHQMDKKKR